MDLTQRPLPTPRAPGQRDEKPPPAKPWKFFSLAMMCVLFLLASILGVALAKVLEITALLQDELNQLNNEFVQGLADARYRRDSFRGEMFRLVEALQAGNGSSCKACPKVWRAFEGSCYYFSNNTDNWFHAKDHCAQHGSHLVIINSEAERTFLKDSIDNWSVLNNMDIRNTYWWHDGSVSTNRNWDLQKFHFYDCVSMRWFNTWSRSYCFWNFNWICEKPQIC